MSAAPNPFKVRAAQARSRTALLDTILADLDPLRRKQLREALSDPGISYDVIVSQLTEWGYPRMSSSTARAYCTARGLR